MMQYNEIGISSELDWPRIRKLLCIGLVASAMVFVGDMMLGYGAWDPSLTGLAQRLDTYGKLPDSTLFWSALLGFIGIPLEGLSYFGIYRLMAKSSPRHAHAYRAGIFGYLMFGGCGVHVPCLMAVFVYKSVLPQGMEAAVQQTVRFGQYFLLPGIAAFLVFYLVLCAAQISAFAKGLTPYPKWCWVFSLPVGMGCTMLVKLAGNNALAHGLMAAWISIGNLWMFGGLLVMMEKVRSKEETDERQ